MKEEEAIAGEGKKVRQEGREKREGWSDDRIERWRREVKVRRQKREKIGEER